MGIPVNALIFILIMATVLGASVYIKNLSSKVEVTALDYSTFTPSGWSNNDVITMSGGDMVTKDFTISNTGSQYRMDASVKFRATSLNDGQCKIWLLDSNSVELGEDTTVTSNALEVIAAYNDINAGTSKSGKWRIQCNPDYSGQVTINLELTSTAEFTFNE